MRKDGIPYVQNPQSYYPPVDYKKLDLRELKQKFIDTCGKSQGMLSNCSRCSSPCEYGKRAMQLLSGEVYNDPPVPLYGGKTLIERAKEENMKRRKEKEEKEAKEMEQPKTNGRLKDPIGWYDEAMAAEDPVEYTMERFNLSKTQAKKKIYSYRYLHKITDKTGKTSVLGKTKKEEPVEETTVEETVKEEKKEPPKVEESAIETKMEALMKLQEKHKNTMLELQEQYEKAKRNYEEISKKIDILCSAMDIMNE